MLQIFRTGGVVARRSKRLGVALCFTAGVCRAGASQMEETRSFSSSSEDQNAKEQSSKEFNVKKLFSDVKSSMKFLNEYVFPSEEEGKQTSGTHPSNQESESTTSKGEGTFLFGLKSSLKDIGEEWIGNLSSSSSSLSDLAKQVSGILGNKTDREKAVEGIIEQARQTKNSGEFQKNQSFSDLVELFQRYSKAIQSTLDAQFGHLDLQNLDPTSLFYFLEHEDEKKTPSWKRRKHRYMYGVDAKEVDAMHDNLLLADISYFDDVDEVKAGLKETQHGKSWELLFCNLESFPGRPAHYVAIKKGVHKSDPLTVLFAVRGTKSIGDVFTDALMDAVEYEGGEAHGGIVESGQWLVQEHIEFLRSLESTTGIPIRVEIVGHSLGAGAATICGMELRKMGFKNVNVVGFGCPAMLSKELSDKCQDFVTTVIADSDVIPRCSSATLANLVLDVLAFDFRDRAMRDVREALEELRKVSPISIASVDLTKVETLVKGGLDSFVEPKLAKGTTQRVQPTLFPPGVCLHVYRDGSGVSCCYVPCDFFSEIDVSRTMISDHLIVGYDWIFLDLMRDYHNDPYYCRR